VDMGAYERTPGCPGTIAEVVESLRVAAGFAAAPIDLARLDVETGGTSGGVIDMMDSLHLLRCIAGLSLETPVR